MQIRRGLHIAKSRTYQSIASKAMAAFKQVTFMLLALWLQSSTCLLARGRARADDDVEARHFHIDSEESKEPGGTARLIKAINFARQQINAASNCSLYKEEVNDLLYMNKHIYGDGEMYELQLHLNTSRCRINDPSCDPVFKAQQLVLPKPTTGAHEHEITTFPLGGPAFTQLIAPLDTPLYSGKEIEIVGETPSNSRGFHITLQSGHEIPAEAPLRVNVKFNTPKGDLIQLEYFTGTWKICSHQQGFIKAGQRFRIVILMEGDQFEVYANGMLMEKRCQSIQSYKEASYLGIAGDVSIERVTGIRELLSAENLRPPLPWLDDIVHFQEHPYVPFVVPLAPHLVVDRTIFITGSIPEDSPEFAITIQRGSEFEPDRANLRLRATFSDDTENTLTLSYRDGSWKDKVFADPVLLPGRSFHIAITCHANYFTITINQMYVAEYHHKLPYHQATHLSILGMVTIDEVAGIAELPEIKFLERPTDKPVVIPVEGRPVRPGRKLRVWADFSEEGEEFQLILDSARVDKVAFDLKIAFPSTGPYFSWNADWELRSDSGADLKFEDLAWLQRRHPIQFQIDFLENSFKVTFYGLWTFDFGYRMPLEYIERVNFKSYGWLIYALDGVFSPASGPSSDSDLGPQMPYPAPFPPHNPVYPSSSSRTCSVYIWVRTDDEIWMNGLVCNADRRKKIEPIGHAAPGYL